MNYKQDEWEEHIQNYSFNVTCQGSVPEAVLCALESTDYEYCIRKAVSLGGDADTQAAIAGSIVAACSPVPDHILNPCLELLDPPLVDVIDNFNDFIGQKSYLES